MEEAVGAHVVLGSHLLVLRVRYLDLVDIVIQLIGIEVFGEFS